MLVSGLQCKAQTQMSKAFVDKELGCQSQFWEVTFLDSGCHILRRPLFVDCSTRTDGSYNLFEQVKNILLLRVARSCFLISNLFIFKKERIQQLKRLKVHNCVLDRVITRSSATITKIIIERSSFEGY
ncbi:Hypothetical_protein [Hexamita inflata]|uniref:Hypothetical_protein n=1 Tax=Hexamita inflata TaxID=28002 RepID=A0AA86TMP3_9EUKA|nr:Hypothetical protein HINF_LOCUS9646 [Hexamita inflata]